MQFTEYTSSEICQWITPSGWSVYGGVAHEYLPKEARGRICSSTCTPYAHTVCPYSICCYRDQSIVRNDRDKARILRIRFPFIWSLSMQNGVSLFGCCCIRSKCLLYTCNCSGSANRYFRYLRREFEHPGMRKSRKGAPSFLQEWLDEFVHINSVLCMHVVCSACGVTNPCDWGGKAAGIS